MDYWKDLDVTTYVNWDDFCEKNPNAKIYMATTKGRHVYSDVSYEPDCFIMFGKESAGIPEEIFKSEPGYLCTDSNDRGDKVAEPFQFCCDCFV